MSATLDNLINLLQAGVSMALRSVGLPYSSLEGAGSILPYKPIEISEGYGSLSPSLGIPL